MSPQEGVVPEAPAPQRAAPDSPTSWRVVAATAVVWLAGTAIVAAGQPTPQRREAAVGAAAAGIWLILVCNWTTPDRGRRYVRSLLGSIVAASLTADAMLRLLSPTGVITVNFGSNGIEERIDLPLIVVLLLPLVGRELWTRRGELHLPRRPRPLDAIFAAYATIVAVPALLLGLAHHDHLSYIGQDLGLLVFTVFAYLAGRLAGPLAARACARDFVDVLLALAVVQLALLNWEPAPFYAYAEAACAAAIGWWILRPGRGGILPLAVAATVLVVDAVAVRNGSNSSTAIELAGALGVVGYLVVRLRPLVPRWLVVAGIVAALAGFIGFTSDGATVRGQYHGPDPSNTGRTFEAQQVRKEIRSSPLSLVLGRGFGATIDERHAPLAFRNSLANGGRDLAHVQEVHLLPYSFLLKEGFLGLAWFFAFVIGLGWAALQGLERAVRERDPSFVIYAAVPVLALAQAIAASSRLQANPLTGLALGLLVTSLAAPLRRPRSS
ncbi:MAG TPA: hypothetical protein VFA37_05795 [Gaiellaceae bacterium]|nr:hypothetical protein [Gaiellaceae bacterium]